MEGWASHITHYKHSKCMCHLRWINKKTHCKQKKGSQSYLKYKFDNMYQFEKITKWWLRFKSWNLNFIYIIHFYLPHGKMELVSMIIAWRLQTLVNVVSIYKWSMDDHVLFMEYRFHLAKYLTLFWCHHLWLKVHLTCQSVIKQ